MASCITINNPNNGGPLRVLLLLLFLTIILLISCFLSSCGTSRDVLHEGREHYEEKLDSLCFTVHDSLIERDTVMINRSGDTIFVNSIHWRYRSARAMSSALKTIYVHDSIFTTDTIYVSAKHINNTKTFTALWKKKKIVADCILLLLGLMIFWIVRRMTKSV